MPPVEVRNKLGIVTIHRLNGLVHARRGLCWVFPGCQDASRPSFLQNFTILSKFDEFGSLPPSRRPARMTKVLMERTVGSHKSGDSAAGEAPDGISGDFQTMRMIPGGSSTIGTSIPLVDGS